MRTEFVLLVIIGGFFSALIIFLIFLYRPVIPTIFNQSSNQQNSEAVSSGADTINELKSKIKWLEGSAKDQDSALKDLKTYVSTQSAQKTVQTNNKSILALANTQGASFTTTATTYTPMGMYVNIKCPVNCTLWINFYTSSKNTGEQISAQGNTNTYGIFLDDADKSIFTQASYPIPSTSVPVSLNVAIPVAAGIHTVDIRTKTTKGTLQSASSALQVMAIER